MVYPLQSTIAVRLFSPWCLPNRAASHTSPSLHSPSPRRANTLEVLPLCFSAQAVPAATENPWPSEPVPTSTPGHFRFGCPWSRLPSFLSVLSSSMGKYPAMANAAYRTGAACPLLRKNRSRFSDPGFAGSCRITSKNRAATMSADDSDAPG